MFSNLVAWVHSLAKGIIPLQQQTANRALSHFVPVKDYLWLVVRQRAKRGQISRFGHCVTIINVYCKIFPWEQIIPVILVSVHHGPLNVCNPKAGNLGNYYNAESFENPLPPSQGASWFSRFLVQSSMSRGVYCSWQVCPYTARNSQLWTPMTTLGTQILLDGSRKQH